MTEEKKLTLEEELLELTNYLIESHKKLYDLVLKTRRGADDIKYDESEIHEYNDFQLSRLLNKQAELQSKYLIESKTMVKEKLLVAVKECNRPEIIRLLATLGKNVMEYSNIEVTCRSCSDSDYYFLVFHYLAQDNNECYRTDYAVEYHSEEEKVYEGVGEKVYEAVCGFYKRVLFEDK